MARHTWPEFWNAPSKMPGATFLGSTSSSTMPASLPPSSSVMRLSVCAALAITFCPVADEPVNEILRISGCLVMWVAKVIGVGDDVEDALRQDVLYQFGKTQRRQRRRRRRLDDERIAGE